MAVVLCGVPIPFHAVYWWIVGAVVQAESGVPLTEEFPDILGIVACTNGSDGLAQRQSALQCCASHVHYWKYAR